ncbi:hypothetical protein VPH35_070854 [Triticum aestivum]
MTGVLNALASYVTKMLAGMARDEVAILIGVSGEIEELGIKLRDLNNFLADADRRDVTDESVRSLVGKLKRAMYQAATDIVDLCQLKAMGQRPSKDMGCLNPLLFCMRNPLHSHDIGTRIKALNKELDSICERGNKFKFAKLEAYQDFKTTRSLTTERKTDSLMERSGVVGEKIEEDTRALVELLTSEEGSDKTGRHMVVAIVGVSGIGKTTLGKKVFNDEAIKGKFTKKIWLSIPHDFTNVELLSTAITATGGDLPRGSGTLNRALLVDALKNAIENKKFLLVLDDLWGVDAWNKLLMTPFGYGGPGSRVLTTTRHETITRNMKAAHCHHVDRLEHEDAWSLLKNQNGHEVDVLKEIGLQIVEKCDGLPLAIEVMEGLLCSMEKSRSAWEDPLNDDIWSDLPHYLKQCFMYFSLKPKKVMLEVNETMSMWICKGLVQGGPNSLEEEGKKNYKELILRNLIEEDPSFPSQLNCNMHDIIRYFGQFMARDEILQKLLRTLIFNGNLKIQPGDSLTHFPSLCLLHIESANIAALVKCIYQLKHLRYLTIKRTDICRLPENVHEMKFLQHINLEGCESFMKLLDSIIKLQGLRYLGDGTRIRNIPRGFRALTNLTTLSGLPAYIDGDWCSLEELGSLSQLNELSLVSLENLSSALLAEKARVNAKKQLTYLGLKCGGIVGDGLLPGEVSDSVKQTIEAVFDVLCPQPCIEHIVIETMAPLESLKILVLEHLPCWTQLPDGLCRLPYLEWIKVDGAPVIKCVGPEFIQLYNQLHRPSSQLAVTFPKLQKLNLYGMEQWQEWVWETEVKAMPLLEDLRISYCKLGRMPAGLVSHAKALKKLEIWNVQCLHSLENFVSVLEITLCPKLKTLQQMATLRRLQLSVSSWESQLPDYLQTIKPSHLLLTCNLAVLTSMAEDESSSECDKFSHIKQVEAYEKKWHVLYTPEPYNIQTNIHQDRLVEEED